MQRSSWLLVSVLSRRNWEQKIASVLAERKETEVDTAARRFDRIYKQRKFTPLEQVAATATAAREAPVATQPANPRVLRVAFLGPQNTGKSSLVNAMAHAHVSVESNRAGSSTECVTAVSTVHDTQLLLMDTPGIVQVKAPKDRKRLAAATLEAWEALFSADTVVLTLSAGLGFLEPEHRSIAREVVRRAGQRQLPVILAVTKMDKVQTPKQKEMYFALRADMESLGDCFARCHETSVKDSKGLVELKDFLCRYGVEGPWQQYRHEPTTLTDPERVSLILKQCFMDCLPHEVPHAMRHRIIGWTLQETGSVEIAVEVFVSRPAYLFTFYSKLEMISTLAQTLAERELRKRVFFVFQGFITPGGMSGSGKG